MNKKLFKTTLRLNLENENDRRALEYLQHMDRTQYKSYTQAIVAAVNSFFERMENGGTLPFLESREREDAFLKKVEDTVKRSLEDSDALKNLHNTVRVSPEPDSGAESIDSEMDAVVFDFLNSI